MPKKLFFKLPPEKQQRILDAAAEEFITYKDNYKKSSVNRIAEKADIAIGSIYKYFYDKNDLFVYLFEQNKKSPASEPSSDTFYDYSKKELASEAAFTATGDVLYSIIDNTPSLFQELVFGDHTSTDYLLRMEAYVQNDSDRGHLRDGLDQELAAYVYASLEFIVYQYCLHKGIDLKEKPDVFSKVTELFFFGLYRDGIEEELR